MNRLFFGIELPESIKRHLGILFKTDIRGAKWVRPDQHHLTLLFLGNVPSHKYQSVLEAAGFAASSAGPFSLHLKGLNFLGPARSPKVIYLCVEKNDILEGLEVHLERQMRSVALELDKKKFHPHVTLARMRGSSTKQLGRFLEDFGLMNFEPFEVKRIVLFESRLASEGATYLVRETFDLELG